MTEEILIAGADLEIIDLAESLGKPILGIIDVTDTEQDYFGYQILGDDKWLFKNTESMQKHGIAITIDNPKIRKLLFETYLANGFKIEELIGTQPRRGIHKGIGTVIQNPSHVSVNITLGDCVKINCGANLMHDCKIGNYTTIAPNAVLLGYVEIGSECFIGAGATVLPRVKIGDGVTVGAGAVVTRNVESGKTVKGVPAKE
jgi:UDP-N-acetylbacillosamine N-acetyltransferase